MDKWDLITVSAAAASGFAQPDGWAVCVRCQCEWQKSLNRNDDDFAHIPMNRSGKTGRMSRDAFVVFFHFIWYSSLVLLQQASVVYSRINIYRSLFPHCLHRRVNSEEFVHVIISFCCIRCASSRKSTEKLALLGQNFSSLPKWHTYCRLKWWKQSSKLAGRIICNCKTHTHNRISFIQNLNLIQSTIYIYLYLC